MIRKAGPHVLTPELAFVVQLRSPVDPQNLSGRSEHVLSGRSSSFESIEELTAFMQNVADDIGREREQIERE